MMLIKPAPLIILGCKPANSSISNNIALVVLLPLVPPTAIVFLLSAIRDNNSERLMIGIFSFLAFCTSATVSSIAVETTIRSVVSVMPSPFCKKHCTPSISSFSLVSLYSPGAKKRSLPLTSLPMPLRYCAIALMPTPATPIKKGFLKSFIEEIILQIKGIIAEKYFCPRNSLQLVSNHQVKCIKTFLKKLTDVSVTTDTKYSNPFK